MLSLIQDGRILFPSNPSGRPREKKFRSELASEHTSYPTIIDDVYTSHGTADVRQLFAGQIFSFPKPQRLIAGIVEQVSKDSDIILDFFPGSCTTAHAILDLNKKDSGNRKFIMVQLPEPCEEKSEAYKAGYKTIADIGKERIRRVIKKIEKEQTAKAEEAKSKLPGMAEELPELDLGFKVLKLDKSNFKIWDGSRPNASEKELEKQLELQIDHIDPKASQEDILFELLLKAGFMPTEKVEKRDMAGKTVYSVADGALLICLENEITRELIDAVAEAEPMQFICLDRGFQGNDQLKANAVQTFAARNQGRDKAEQIVFRTV
jgi:adenine-specific DNA-methyltransferase